MLSHDNKCQNHQRPRCMYECVGVCCAVKLHTNKNSLLVELRINDQKRFRTRTEVQVLQESWGKEKRSWVWSFQTSGTPAWGEESQESTLGVEVAEDLWRHANVFSLSWDGAQQLCVSNQVRVEDRTYDTPLGEVLLPVPTGSPGSHWSHEQRSDRSSFRLWVKNWTFVSCTKLA